MEIWSEDDDDFVPKKKPKNSPSVPPNNPSPNSSFICSFCASDKFSSKDNLQRHQKTCKKNPTSNSFRCEQCNSSFSRKDNLQAHLKRCGTKEKKKRKIMCLHKDCKEEFWTKICLIEHLKTIHKSPIQPALNLKFASEADFISWKDTEEAKTFSYFPQDSGSKNGRFYLYCQHDGTDQAHRKKGEEARKTSRKVRIGQIKRGATCIAKMVVVVSEDGTRDVEYFPTHSHPLSSHDYAHQPPSSATNAFIDNQVALGLCQQGK